MEVTHRQDFIFIQEIFLQILQQVQPTAGVDSAASQSAFSATSRSLSGAPYLLTTSYSYKFNSEVSKSFDPGFGYASNILVNSLTTDTWDNVGSTSLSNATTTVANTGVSSTGATNYVIDSTITTKRQFRRNT